MSKQATTGHHLRTHPPHPAASGRFEASHTPLPLDFRLVVHHLGAAEKPRRSPLPANPFAKFALFSLIGAAGAVGLLGVAAFGGLDTHDPNADPAAPGTELKNDLVIVTPHEAWIRSDGLGTYLQVRVDIEMRGSDRPVPMDNVGGSLVVHAEPTGESVKGPEINFERQPKGYVSHLQPHMVEESAVLSWEVPQNLDVDAVEGLGFVLHGIEELQTTGDRGSLWVGTEDVVGAVSLPLDGAERT